MIGARSHRWPKPHKAWDPRSPPFPGRRRGDGMVSTSRNLTGPGARLVGMVWSPSLQRPSPFQEETRFPAALLSWLLCRLGPAAPCEERRRGKSRLRSHESDQIVKPSRRRKGGKGRPTVPPHPRAIPPLPWAPGAWRRERPSSSGEGEGRRPRALDHVPKMHFRQHVQLWRFVSLKNFCAL